MIVCGAQVSIDTLVRGVIAHVDGCGSIAVAEVDVDEPITCDDRTELAATEILAMLFENVNGVPGIFPVQVDAFSEEDLCADLTLRATCGHAVSLEEMLKEATMFNDDGGAGIRIAYLDKPVACVGCDDVLSGVAMRERIAGSFVRLHDLTCVLVAQPEVGGDAIDCDTTEISLETLLSSTLVPVGDCGMWAWQVGFI